MSVWQLFLFCGVYVFMCAYVDVCIWSFLFVYTQYSVWLCILGMPLGGNKVIILDQ